MGKGGGGGRKAVDSVYVLQNKFKYTQLKSHVRDRKMLRVNEEKAQTKDANGG